MAIDVTVDGGGGVVASVGNDSANATIKTTGNIQVQVGGSQNIRSVPKQATTRPLVSQGEKKPVIVPDSVVLGIDTIGEYIRRIDAGPGIIVFPEDDIESANVVISHANTSNASSTTNLPGNFISNIDIDQFGHITGFENNNTIAFATQLETARDIELQGVINGVATFDGSSNAVITTTSIDFTLGSTSLTLGETTPDILGLTSISVGDFTLSSSTLASDNTIIIQSGGNVNLSNAKLENVLDPTDDQDAATKIYVDTELTALEIDLLDVSTPVDPTDAANKQYVDDIAQSIVLRTKALAATTTDLGGTYLTGTITLSPTSTLTIDDVSNWSLSDLLLVKDQDSQIENGIYELTQVGDAGTNWIFSRSEYNNATNEMPGSFVFVTDGTTNRETSWVATVSNTETFVLDLDTVIFKQFSGEGTFTAGAGLDITGTDFSVNVDNVTIEIVNDTLEVKDNGISNDKLQNESIIIGSTAVILGNSTTEIRDVDLLTIHEIEGINNRLTLDSIIVDVASTGGLIIPVGSTIQRPPEQTGMIRFNTTDARFEAYNGIAWTGLGGVVDVDQDTFVLAESAPGADNDQLDFFTAGQNRLQIDSDGTFNYGAGLNKFTIDYATGDTDIAGNLNVVGDITLEGNIRIGDQDVDTIEVVADFTSNLTPDVDATYNLGSLNKNWNRLYTRVIDSNTEIVNIDTTGALIIPVGGNTERPVAETGMIRFNTDDSRFEAYNGSIWAGLSGSVIDIDQDTRIVAEDPTGADNDQLDFYTAGTHRLRLDDDGSFKFGTGLNKFTISSTGATVIQNALTVDTVNISTGILSFGTDLDFDVTGSINITTANTVIFDTANDIEFGGVKLTNVANPTANTDVVTYDYLENGSFARSITIIDNANTFSLDLLSASTPPILSVGRGMFAQFDQANNEFTWEIANTAVDPGTYGVEGFIPQFTVDSTGRILTALDIPIAFSANAVVDFTESTQDIAGQMWQFSVQEGVRVLYIDSPTGNPPESGKMEIRVDNFDIELTGDINGTAQVTRASNTTISTSITVDYLEGLTANAGIEIDLTPGVAAFADIRHGNTSDIANTTNGAGVVINDIEFDEFGHVIAVVSEDLNVNFVNVEGDSMTGPLTVPSIIDANNANYFVNPDGLTVLNDLDVTGDLDIAGLTLANGSITVTEDVSANNVFANNVIAQQFTDADNNSYYLDPAGTSILNDITVNDIIASSFVDVDDPSFFVDPSGTTNLNNLTIGGSFSAPGGDILASRYVDADDQTFYVDPAGQSRVNNITFGYGGAFSFSEFTDDLGSTTLLIGFQGNFGTYNASNSFLWYADKSADVFHVTNELQAPKFVDRNNTLYFVNPAGTDSRISGLNVDNDINLTSGSSTININNAMSLTQNSISTLFQMDLIPGNNILNVNNSKITSVVDPVDPQEAATKNYVDTSISTGITGLIGGEGLTYTPGTFTFDVNVDDSTIEIVGDTLQVANSGITNAKIEFPFIEITGDLAATDNVFLGETLSIIGGEGIDTSISNNAITIAGELATNSNIGVASFAAANFAVAAGAVTVTTIDGGTY